MKTIYILVAILTFGLFSSFASSEACNYANSNMGFVKTQTQNAISENDINKSRFFIYKAIKGIQSNSSNFKDCGCTDAEVSIDESLMNLKAAAKATSIKGTHILLNEALLHIIDVFDALEQHEMHDNSFSSKEFAMNTSTEAVNNLEELKVTKTEMQQHIDASLLNYEASLQKVVSSVKCSEATAYAKKIYEHCEQKLLNHNLSEGMKYYNFRVKDITATALKSLEGCKD